MRPIDVVDDWIKGHLVAFLKERHLHETDEASGANSAYRQFSNQWITVRVEIDRGCSGMAVGPAHTKQDLIPVDVFKDFLDPADIGRWNLSLEQQLQNVIETYDWFKNNLSPERNRKTFAAVNARCDETFPYDR